MRVFTSALVSQKRKGSREGIAAILTKHTFHVYNCSLFLQNFVLCGRSLLLQSVCVYFSGTRQTRFNLLRFPLQQRINGNVSFQLFLLDDSNEVF